MPRTTSVTLGEEQQRFIETLVRSGRYASASEVIREALRGLEDAQGSEWLLRQLLVGERGEAKEWQDQELKDHVRAEARRRGCL